MARVTNSPFSDKDRARSLKDVILKSSKVHRKLWAYEQKENSKSNEHPKSDIKQTKSNQKEILNRKQEEQA